MKHVHETDRYTLTVRFSVPRGCGAFGPTLEVLPRMVGDALARVFLSRSVSIAECSLTRAGGSPPREVRGPSAKRTILIEDDMTGAVAGMVWGVYV